MCRVADLVQHDLLEVLCAFFAVNFGQQILCKLSTIVDTSLMMVSGVNPSDFAELRSPMHKHAQHMQARPCMEIFKLVAVFVVEAGYVHNRLSLSYQLSP